MRRLSYGQAISEATVQCMEADPSIFVAGIGVDDFKGIFGTTFEAHRRFGAARVFDIPNGENAMTGIAIGAAAMGKRPLIVHPRNDFMFLCMDQLANLAAKWRYMFANGSGVPIVLRGIVGRGWGQGATHSQSLQAMFAHFPGLYVGTPATPADAKGLLVSALQGTGPVVLLENRALYELEGEVPEGLEPVPFGKGAVTRPGKDITIVGISLMAYEALRAAAILAEQGIDAEVIDLRSLSPWDSERVYESVKRTSRVIVAYEDSISWGYGAEIAARIADDCFAWLDAPVKRVASTDTFVGYAPQLEDAILPQVADFKTAIAEIMAF